MDLDQNLTQIEIAKHIGAMDFFLYLYHQKPEIASIVSMAWNDYRMGMGEVCNENSKALESKLWN